MAGCDPGGPSAGPGSPGRPASLEVEVEPGEVGLDPVRLRRLDRGLAGYVEAGQLPGWLLTVSRHGRVAYLGHGGRRDLEAGTPVEPDTVFRIYSMTKPITSVAALLLYEEGLLALTDPVSRFLPEFGSTRVYRAAAGQTAPAMGGPDGTVREAQTEPLAEPIQIWHLLTHTAGLTYGWQHAHPVDQKYREAGYAWGSPPGVDLATACRSWASLPLLFQPGSEWNYSVATDVLGRVVEVVSGLSLDRFFQERIFGPLDMVDTGFSLRNDQQPRLATLYAPTAALGGSAAGGRLRRVGRNLARPPDLLSGGGGLLSTVRDYHRFAQLLLHDGELDGHRLLSPRTVRFLRTNQLPGGADLVSFGRPIANTPRFDGAGFGLGVSVVLDPVPGRVVSSIGEFGWSGAAGSTFFVAPAEGLVVVFMTQVLASVSSPVRSALRQLVYQALVDQPSGADEPVRLDR